MFIYCRPWIINNLWSRVLLENLAVPQLVKKIRAFQGGFLSPLPLVPRHMSLSWVQISRVHSLPHYFLRILLRLSSRFLPGLPSSFFSSGFPYEAQYSFLLSPVLFHFKQYFWPNTHNSPLVLYTSLFCDTVVAPGKCVMVLERKPEGKRLLGRPRYRWEESIKRNLREIWWGHGLDSSGSGQGQVVGSCERRNEPSGSIQCRGYLKQLRTFRFSRRILFHGGR